MCTADKCTQSASLVCLRGSGLIGARSPSGAPRRLLSQRPNAATQPRPCFTRPRGRRRYPRRPPRLSEAPRAPVVMPTGTMPGPPGGGVTSPARRNRTRPIQRLSPVDVPEVGDIRSIVADLGTPVKAMSRQRCLPACAFLGPWSRPESVTAVSINRSLRMPRLARASEIFRVHDSRHRGPPFRATKEQHILQRKVQ